MADDGDGRDAVAPWARRNLLYMLSVSNSLPVKERDLAVQGLEEMPLLEVLIAVFAGRLLDELSRGIDRTYLYLEENSQVVRGRILLSQQLKINAGRMDRIAVGYDTLSADTNLNRILKRTCYLLLNQTGVSTTEQQLRIATLHFSDVMDVNIRSHDFSAVHLNRNSERFTSLLQFCRIIHDRLSPAASHGEDATFSLLFPMDALFEEFIGRFLQKHAASFDISRHRVHLQARNRRRWLLETGSNRGVFRLKPDILIEDGSGNPELIIDTKWKRLLADAEDRKNGGVAGRHLSTLRLCDSLRV